MTTFHSKSEVPWSCWDIAYPQRLEAMEVRMVALFALKQTSAQKIAFLCKCSLAQLARHYTTWRTVVSGADVNTAMDLLQLDRSSAPSQHIPPSTVTFQGLVDNFCLRFIYSCKLFKTINVLFLDVKPIQRCIALEILSKHLLQRILRQRRTLEYYEVQIKDVSSSTVENIDIQTKMFCTSSNWTRGCWGLLSCDIAPELSGPAADLVKVILYMNLHAEFTQIYFSIHVNKSTFNISNYLWRFF